MDKRPWTDAEVSILKEKYPTCGSKIPELDRTPGQILSKAGTLGLRKGESIVFRGVRYDTIPLACSKLGVAYTSVLNYKRRVGATTEQALEHFISGDVKAPPWEKWEEDILREEYPDKGSKIERLSHRSAAAIVRRAIALGVKSNRFHNDWSEGDIQLLRKHYEDGCDISSLVEKFGSAAVRNKSIKLGLMPVDTARWEGWEDDLLRKKYRECGSAIPELLDRRTSKAIISRATKLGVAGSAIPKWSDEELKILREKYSEYGTDIPELSGRSVCSIRGKACELGIKYRETWTDAHVEVLKSLYPSQGWRIPELLEVFTEEQIRSKANTLKLRKDSTPDNWTEEEDNLIREKYPTCGSDIPELANRPGSAIMHRAKRLGVRDTRRVTWPEEHLDILRKNYPSLGPDIPELLEFYTRSVIIKKAGYLKIRMEGRNVSWTPEEERIIAENYGSMTAEELCALLPGRTPGSIYAYINKRGMVKEVNHSQTWKERAALIPQAPPAGYKYVKCSVCGQIFISDEKSLSMFSHETHSFPVPDGWFAPVEHTKVI